MPFRYASLNSFWLFYAVRRESVEALLPDLPAGHGVRLADFTELDGTRSLTRRPGLNIMREHPPGHRFRPTRHDGGP